MREPSGGEVHEKPVKSASGSRARIGLQVLGFIVGLGLLGWCVMQAVNPDNRQHLAKLRGADWRLVTTLAGLSAASLLVNGLSFWSVIRPVRRVPMASVIAVNAMATALASLPFKLSVICRFVVHHRRDGVPLLTITTWMGNSLTIMLATLVPILLVSLWKTEVDAAWCAAVLTSIGISASLVIVLARAGSSDRVWAWAENWFGALPAGASEVPTSGRWRSVRRLVARFDVLAKAREGVRMLSFPSGVYGAAGLRVVDITIQAARFVVAARLLEQVMAPADALLAAALYFIVGVASPAGSLGFREAAVLGVHAAGTGDGESGAGAGSIVVLTVTAVDTLVVVGAAIASGAYLRIDRFFLKSRGSAGNGT